MAGSPQGNTLINAAKNPTGKNLQEISQLPMQNIPIPETARQVGQAAFESQVAPLRKGFGERLETTIGETARRGIAFGGAKGPGAQRVDKLIESQSELEGQIASNIGSNLGQTLLDQAFISSENAKRFEESKEFAEFGAKLNFGTDAEGNPVTQIDAQKDLAEFSADLDIDTQKELADMNIENQKSLYEYTSTMDLENKKNFSEFITGLDTEAKKDFLKWSTDLDVEAKKDIATFMTSLEADTQKDMAAYMSKLNTEQAKEIASYTSNLDYEGKVKFSDYIQSLKGGVDDNGNPLSDIDIAQKMADISTESQKTMTNFVNSATRGVNPDTGEAYTDYDMANIANDLEIDRAERMTDIQKEMVEFTTILDRGTNEDGEPLTQIEFGEMSARMQNKLQNEFSKKAFEESLIAEYGPNGVEIAKNLADVRGDAMANDLKMLNSIELDDALTDSEKQDLTRLILSGAGWESEPVREILQRVPNSLVARDFLSVPEPSSVLTGASKDLKDYLVSKGIGRTKQRSSGGGKMSPVTSRVEYDIDLDDNEDNLALFNELYRTDPEFRKTVGRG